MNDDSVGASLRVCPCSPLSFGLSRTCDQSFDSGDYHEIRISLGFFGSSNLLSELGNRNQLLRLSSEAVGFGKHLVLDRNRGRARRFKLLDRILNIGGVSITGVTVSDQWNG